MTPEKFIALDDDEKTSFLTHVGLLRHKVTLIRRLKDCLEGKPLPPPSEMKWIHVRRILEGSIPMTQTVFMSTMAEGECPVDDTFLEMLNGVFNNNFKNVTEMEAVMRVGIVIACAVSGCTCSHSLAITQHLQTLCL